MVLLRGLHFVKQRVYSIEYFDFKSEREDHMFGQYISLIQNEHSSQVIEKQNNSCSNLLIDCSPFCAVVFYTVKSLLFMGYQFFVVFVGRLIHEIKNATNNETWEAV